MSPKQRTRSLKKPRVIIAVRVSPLLRVQIKQMSKKLKHRNLSETIEMAIENYVNTVGMGVVKGNERN